MSKEPDNSPNVVKLNPHKNKGKKAVSAKVCPICANPAADEYSPFCSKRCANLDLGRWLGGGYGIPTNEAPTQAPDFDDEEDG